MLKNDEFYINEIKFNNIKSRKINSSKYYKILFIFSGDCLVSFNESTYTCTIDNILLISPNNSVNISMNSKKQLLIYELSLTTNLLNTLSNEEVDLLYSFNVVPYHCAIVDANLETTMLIKNILRKLLIVKDKKDDFANDLYNKNMLSMIVILILRSCIHSEPRHRSNRNRQLLVDDVFLFINSHITEEITLERLEREFFVSKFHISREFKKATGMTIHSYITKSKLKLCKKLIEEGKSISNVAHLCGLGGYNNLFRVFKKEFGMTPKQYYNDIRKYKNI
ncbi:helix-turn-helix transcriptional regulator [Romboutsia sp.]|uniref:helix-turn-helix transcriptional regulator n=1 Tax=Romboutsia sp. TaxID=1965302 RepID=UPI003F2D723A